MTMLETNTNNAIRLYGVAFERPNMKCPFCGVEMIHGYLNCGMTLWSTKKHKISFLLDDNEEYALQLGRPLTSPHHVESDCCPKCKRIIIDSSDYMNNIECMPT